jgi:hypothetical protein
MSTLAGAAMTMLRAPCGLANITTFARSMVMLSEEIAISARPDSSVGIR